MSINTSAPIPDLVFKNYDVAKRIFENVAKEGKND